MRRLLAAVLAVPVILAIYVSRSLRRPVAPQALLALALPVLLLGLSVVRMELTPRPVAAGVAGAVATPLPDSAFEPVSLGAAPEAGISSVSVAAAPAATRATARPAARIVDHPDRDLGGARREAAAREARRPPEPSVVRFRPAAKSTEVAPSAEVSVRFTQPMDEAATAKTFTITAGGKPVPGKVRWAEGSTVLVFRPAKPLPSGATVVASVSGDAVSARGAGIARSSSIRFTVAKPAPKPKTTTKPAPKSSGKKTTPIPKSVAPGLYGVELYALELMNCTRTGGTVLSNGSCRGGGTRNVAPLKLDKRISDTVARPYAQLLASRRLCHHFYDGNPGHRLRRAGFTNWDWAENVGGCGSNVPYASVLSTHLYFQSEKSYNGGHYRNLMNRKYDRVGIGIVKVKGVFRMVVDFYHP